MLLFVFFNISIRSFLNRNKALLGHTKAFLGVVWDLMNCH